MEYYIQPVLFWLFQLDINIIDFQKLAKTWINNIMLYLLELILLASQTIMQSYWGFLYVWKHSQDISINT